ncbi:phospholysine phosphohistidine inorganic pyrophosphate phosphatase-like isoform X2 [Mercenaria mercenaria]|uniref:phospholysine phosphohistidine inorganic pyrophosphate phosphatase-like isoform X2 n=1 Tax=Mercenaria mercenaria TaxID=6596 RepID=UPI00234EF1A2|nr:phospholysine phosphohistidine inorganic pyrophosphate phosphatase-like isoform X2 [Mercenaria mercenaria]
MEQYGKIYIRQLKASSLPVRFCTNETTTTRKCLVEKLSKVGFELKETEIFPPIPAICKILQQRNLRPYLIVTDDSRPDFAGIDQTNPNCVVIGDAESNFSYENLNKAFQLLMCLEKPVLFSLGKGKYYKHGGKLVLDAGPFMKALEFACDIQAEVVGKPEPAFFNTAVQDMGISADTCVMVGDDIVGDIGGAQNSGMRGVQVRTGKYRPEDENHPTVKPDGFVDNLAQAVDLILAGQSK